MFDGHPARPFGAGPLQVEITCDEAEVADRFERLFAAMPDPPANPVRVVPVQVRQRGQRYQTLVDGISCCVVADLRRHETSMASRLNRLVLDHEPELPHVHGAVVERDGHGVLLLGATGSGKSTLTAELLRRGWRYLTDEMTAVEPDARVLRPYPRPLSLKRGSWDLFPELAIDSPTAHRRMDRMEIPIERLGARTYERPIPAALIVLVDWSGGEPTAADVTAAECLDALVAAAFDLERAGTTGIEAFADLAATTPAIRLESGDLEATAAIVEAELSRAVGCRRAASMRAIPPVSRTLRAPDARAWEFGDVGNGAIYEPTSGVLLRVDPAGLRVWDALGQIAIADDRADDHVAAVAAVAAAVGAPASAAPDIAGFIDALAEQGLVVR